MGFIDTIRYRVARNVSKVPETSLESVDFLFHFPIIGNLPTDLTVSSLKSLHFKFLLSVQSTNPNDYVFSGITPVPEVLLEEEPSLAKKDLLMGKQGALHSESVLVPGKTKSGAGLILRNIPLISENFSTPLEKSIRKGGTSSLLVSKNLFVPLKELVVQGKNYLSRKVIPTLFQGTKTVDQENKTRFGKVAKIPTGPKKGTGTDMWDLLLPCLQPPVDLNFVSILELPPDCEPYGYQWEGIQFLAERESALLGDDMGTGKTVQSSLACRLLFQKAAIQSTLIVSPLSVVEQWETELQKWAPALQTIVVKGQASHRKDLWKAPTHIRLTNYEILRQDMGYLAEGGQAQFDLVILDEAQRIKNPASGISKSVHRLQCRYKWGLSGTPIENSIDDLVSIFSFIQPKLFSRVEGLSPERVKDLIKPYFLRRRLADVIHDLPEKKEHPVWLVLGDEQQETYDEMERKRVLELHNKEETITAHNIVVLIGELKKICNRDPVTGSSTKLNWLVDNLANICESGNKSLVFTQYKQATFGGREWLEEQLQGFGALSYDGTGGQKKEIIRRFVEGSDKHVLIANPRTAGVGLNDLVAANYVIHFDHWWNPAVTNQATARAHRPGQQKSVFVYNLWVRNTIEEMIDDTVKRKMELYGRVIDTLSKEEGESVLVDIWEGLLHKHGFESLPWQKEKGEKTVKTDSLAPTYEKLISDISPDGFEKLVAGLFSAMGFKAKETPRSHDGGVDVIAIRGDEKLAIQCKHQRQPVGRPVLQQLLGVISADPSYSSGLVVTTANASRGARSMAGDNGQLRIIEGAQLKGLVEKYKVDVGHISEKNE